MEEHRDQCGRVVHGLNEWIVEIRFIDGVPRLTKAEIRDHVHRYAAKGEEKVRRLSSSGLTCKGCAEIVHLGKYLSKTLIMIDETSCGG